MTGAEKLLPCPFCGGEAEVSPHCGAFYVSCRSCAATSPVCTRAEAIAAWNNRARTPATDMREAAAREERLQFALAYLGSCTAATAEGLLDRKSSPKSELRRHRSICNMLLSAMRGEDINERLSSSSIVGTEHRLRSVITALDARLAAPEDRSLGERQG